MRHCIKTIKHLEDKHGHFYERLVVSVAPNGWIAKHSIYLKK